MVQNLGMKLGSKGFEFRVWAIELSGHEAVAASGGFTGMRALRRSAGNL